jgi:SAM-dependent methyltransferase
MSRFLDLSMMTTDIYPEVLERIKHGENFLDLGCCLGQEIRKLVFDGAPSTNTYGVDLCEEFLAIGYELFKDKDRLQTTFIAADVFAGFSRLTELAGQMNIIYTGDFFHLFNLEDQEKIAVKVIQLLVPQPGSLILGRQSGNEDPGEYLRSGDTSGRKHFRHNPQSWKEMWDRVGVKTESRWSVNANLRFLEFPSSAMDGMSTVKQNGEGPKGLRYHIKRL